MIRFLEALRRWLRVVLLSALVVLVVSGGILALVPHQMLHAVQYGRDREVLGADDVQGFRHSALLFGEIRMPRARSLVLDLRQNPTL